MATEVLLVQQGMGMLSGVIVQWLKHPGETVTKGEVLAEAENAKITFEVVAPCAGVLDEIFVSPGIEVPVRTVLARISDRG